jgi:hypothetical protein
VVSPQGLIEALGDVPEDSYVRVIAHWLTVADSLDVEPPPTGQQLIDVLVAAATAHRAQSSMMPIPGWTNSRELASYWHPGEDAFFGYSLAHAPQAFFNRGVLIEADSLESV